MFELKSSVEDTCQSWCKPASRTESQKCENALRMIKDAIRESDELKGMDIQIIPKGSYHNNTNVRLNSDVDIAVVLKKPFFADYPKDKGDKDFGNASSSYKFSDYRDAVERALHKKFGSENVNRGNKAFDLHSNSYRVDADVVPCLEHRRYKDDGTYTTGTAFDARFTGERVENYPVQHYENGTNKNTLTSRRYKRVVRILKRLRYKMKEDGHEYETISSFLIECLVWNVPNSYFRNAKLSEDVEAALDFLIHNTSNLDLCGKWGEVSELLYLFHSGRKYTRTEVNDFLKHAKTYLFN
ncbi:nucleotidyltransferase [Bacillus anthracis]|nr:nucleotidyltransferase [Bacillus anthracis]